MNRTEFESFLRESFETISDLNATKGNDYSGEDNPFRNFEQGAQRTGLTKYQVLLVYLMKHLDAIETWVRDGEVKSEPIEGRIQDAILYLLLLAGMIASDAKSSN